MNSSTYVYILKDTLKKKLEVLDKIIGVVEEQEKVLLVKLFDVDEFDNTILAKEPLILKLEELDDGFDKIYDRVSDELRVLKETFKNDIIDLQNMIRLITEKSVHIQTMERKNENLLKTGLMEKKREIKSFKTSNQVVNNYYKNMGSAYQGESYFLDKKK